MGLELFTNITLSSAVVLVVGVLSFTVGALVYSRDIHRVDNLFFFLLAWSFAIWAVFLGMFEAVNVGDLEYLLLKGVYLFATLIPPAVLFFAMALSMGGKVMFTKIKVFFILSSFAVVSSSVFIPGFLFKSIENTQGVGKEIVFGQGFYVFIVYIFLYVVIGSTLLFKKYKKSAGIFKTEIGYVFSSILLGTFFILSANIVLPYFGFYDLFWLGPVVGFLVVSIIGYLIIKYNFWNLKLAATDLFTSVISFILLFELFLSSSIPDFIVKMMILSLVLLSGFFLVRSVKHEIDSKEEVEKLAKKLADVNTNLHQLDKQKSEFVANSAHHLRDPLTAIKGYASMVLDGSFGELSKDAKEAMERIYKSSQRLVVIVNDFMDIAKIESGKMDYVFSKVNLLEMVKDLAGEMAPAAKEAGLELRVNIDEKQDYCVNVDEGKIRQVVSNLMDNAIKYTPHGSVGISLTKNPDGKKIILSIFDTGIGMSPKTVKKIFHKFSRADEASKFHTGGSGLGLYVAKEIFKKHNGRIWAESLGLGKGSTFNLELKSV